MNENDQAKRGDGWWGRGAPIRVRHGQKVRDLEDGAGIGSPGRRSPSCRTLPSEESMAAKLVEAMELDREKWDHHLMSMLAGKMPDTPFAPGEIEKGKASLVEWAAKQGHHPTPEAGDTEQSPKPRLLQALLRSCQHPDAEALDVQCVGVRLGYLQRMPRTPAVFNKKERWRLHYEDPGVPADPGAPNYKTARERAGCLEKKNAEDIGCGRMQGLSHKTAKERLEDRLLFGALGVIE